MKVLFLSDARQIGGSETYLREILPRLRRLGLEAEAALPRSEATRPIWEALMDQGIPVHLYRSLEDLPRDPDLVVASAWYPQSYPLFMKRFPQLAILVHDQIEIHYPLGGRYLYRLGYRLLQAPNLRRARAVITVSLWAKEALEKLHRIPRVYAVPNGVDPERFRPPSPEERAHLREQLGLRGFAVLTVARMSPEKNHLAVLLTARLLPQVQFLLAGQGPLMGFLKRTAQHLGLRNLRFLGKYLHMPELYRAVDAVLLPTLGENQSLATLEAMASGLPVVTTPIPAQRELIRNEEEGLLLPPWPSTLARGLKRLAEDRGLRERLGAQARRRVLEEHTLDLTVPRLKACLEELV